MKQTINIHIDKLVDKIEINNPNETGSLHERIEEIIFDALTEAIFSPELKNTEAKSSLSARQNNIERAFNSVRFSAEKFKEPKWIKRDLSRYGYYTDPAQPLSKHCSKASNSVHSEGQNQAPSDIYSSFHEQLSNHKLDYSSNSRLKPLIALEHIEPENLYKLQELTTSLMILIQKILKPLP
ncbi:hypothetical protein [Elizabethkingia anophelis]|uniref:hypothetical protein n=1 Tax=Elizabethkingia anophelis TaxID=1117645 RepID=UPI00131711EB|nr:hypothetical protein [Elizabethkingia anophelis]MBE9393696.1 hypothetical protein [Elizabethkingia anophelis]MBE9405703.1 hypothetical protein [Elizabethkingia anophelis]BBQ07542.1 hypothetical protein JUNP353_2113 [Elizabethkingia anophelis]